MVRVVGLSATLPNYEDVASFLRVDPSAGLFHFDGAYRPVPLAQTYVGVTVRKPLQRHALMNDICYARVMDGAGKHQTLVFVHSRKDTVKTARFIRDAASRDGGLARLVKDGSASAEILATEADACKDAALRDLLPAGIAVHHAGMARADRTLVEDLFADGHVSVLVSTATLAWGVNLPAHTVIIKGTQVYSPEKGGWGELSPLDVGQMVGRAGRPQYDTRGEAVIITSAPELQFYLSLFNTQLPVESQLAAALPDALNAEVVLGSVSSLADAAAWLGYTYFHVRSLCAPSLYGVSNAALADDPRLLERRLDLAHSAALALERAGLVRYDRAAGALAPTDVGRAAAHYYVGHHTMATYADAMRASMGDIELLRVFALSDEFRNVVVRDEEKVELAKLLDRVPVPVKEPADDPVAKVNALLQAYISRLPLDGFALAADMTYVRDSGARLMRCLFELALKRGWARVAAAALKLAKCTQRRMWACQTPLRQFKGVLPDLLARVERKDVPWDRYADLSAAELGELVRAPKLGKTLHRLVHALPRLDLAAHVQPITRSVLKVDLALTPDFVWDDALHGGAVGWWVLVEDADGDALLHAQYFVLPRPRGGGGGGGGAPAPPVEHAITFTVPVADPLPPQYFVRVVADAWLGAEAVLPLSFRHLILPAKFPPPTELLDLAPLPVAALRNPAAADGQFGRLIFGFAVTEALGIFALLIAFLLLFAV
jgi:pre-mRNA-splicing helicase BRR2